MYVYLSVCVCVSPGIYLNDLKYKGSVGKQWSGKMPQLIEGIAMEARQPGSIPEPYKEGQRERLRGFLL